MSTSPLLGEELKALSVPCSDSKAIAQVGTISANSDETVGKLIAEAMDKVGKEGVITVEDGTGLQDELDVVEGLAENIHRSADMASTSGGGHHDCKGKEYQSSVALHEATYVAICCRRCHVPASSPPESSRRT